MLGVLAGGCATKLRQARTAWGAAWRTAAARCPARRRARAELARLLCPLRRSRAAAPRGVSARQARRRRHRAPYRTRSARTASDQGAPCCSAGSRFSSVARAARLPCGGDAARRALPMQPAVCAARRAACGGGTTARGEQSVQGAESASSGVSSVKPSRQSAIWSMRSEGAVLECEIRAGTTCVVPPVRAPAAAASQPASC
jgi:hypothetical protein